MGTGNCYEVWGEMGREDFIIGSRETWMEPVEKHLDEVGCVSAKFHF